MFRTTLYLLSFALVLSLVSTTSADLIVHWTLEEGSGTTAHDVSGNSRDGTFTGEPQWVSGHNSAGALHFDGIDDFVVHSLGGAQNYETISVALWVKADTLGQPAFCSPFTSHYRTAPASRLTWTVEIREITGSTLIPEIDLPLAQDRGTVLCLRLPG